MIISFIEMLGLPNLGHMTTSTIQFEPCDFAGDIMDINYDVIAFTSKYRFFKKALGSPFR